MDIVLNALNLIKKYVYNTPVLYSPHLSELYGNQVYLKLDSLQITGAFKIRGVLNFLLHRQQKQQLPQKIVAYSTGNHALAIAYAARVFDVQARIYLPVYASSVKKEMARHIGGAEVVEVVSRAEAERKTIEDSLHNGFTAIPPSDDDSIIAGAGTMCYEALLKMQSIGSAPDAIFAPCGGGGLLAGSYLAKNELSSKSKLYGVEPSEADDAFRSVRDNSIASFSQSPMTVADGLRALNVSNKTLDYLRRLDNIYLVEEQEIIRWNKYLNNILPVQSEFSATISLAAAQKWSQDNKNKTILILISGGNIDSM